MSGGRIWTRFRSNRRRTGFRLETEVQLGDLISVIDFVTSLQAVTALIVSNLTDSFSFMVACDYAYSF